MASTRAIRGAGRDRPLLEDIELESVTTVNSAVLNTTTAINTTTTNYESLQSVSLGVSLRSSRSNSNKDNQERRIGGISKSSGGGPSDYSVECKGGVYHVQSLNAVPVEEAGAGGGETSSGEIGPPALFHEYVKDEAHLRSISSSGVTKTFCSRELGLLQRSFSIHQLLIMLQRSFRINQLLIKICSLLQCIS